MHKLEVTHPEAAKAALRRAVMCSPQSRFVHRLHCVLLVAAGRSCYEVAALFGDDPRSIERWVHEYEQRGIEALCEKPHGGRHPSLSNAQLQQLKVALGAPPCEVEQAASEWNSRLLRAEIVRRFGVSMSARHCRRLLRILV